MEQFLSVIFIVVPASAVLFGMYLTTKAFIGKELEKTKLDIKKTNSAHLNPIRLQAYERICLLLERASPNNLVIRVNNPEFNVAMLHGQLLSELRNELNHNLSQQIYVSDMAWALVKKSIDETTAVINQSYAQIPNKEQRGVELAKVIFNLQSTLERDYIQEALLFLKQELRKTF